MDGHNEDIVFEHLELLTNKGLINASLGSLDGGPRRIIRAYVRSLTWQGHEFLDNARNEEVWGKTKEIVKEKGGSASFEIFTGVMTNVAMKIFGLG